MSQRDISHIQIDKDTKIPAKFIRRICCDDALCLTDVFYDNTLPPNKKTFITYKEDSPREYATLYSMRNTQGTLYGRLLANARKHKLPHRCGTVPRYIDWEDRKVVYADDTKFTATVNFLFRE